jgi:hypothetical protein
MSIGGGGRKNNGGERGAIDFKEKHEMKAVRNQFSIRKEFLAFIVVVILLSVLPFFHWHPPIENARIRRLQQTFEKIEVAMMSYKDAHATYPPAYGFIDFDVADEYHRTDTIPEKDRVRYHLKPYLFYLGFYGVEDFDDPFAYSFDINEDMRLGLLEYSPIGESYKYDSSGELGFPRDLYDGSVPPADWEEQEERDSLPFVYAPVNMRQFKRAERYWINTGDYLATSWDRMHPLLKDVQFPPPRYDAYALISVGLRNRTFGIVDPEIDGASPLAPLGNERANTPETLCEVYHVRALRAFFLASRDLDQNGHLDFHFRDRIKLKEGNVEPYEVKRTGAVTGPTSTNNRLPDREMQDGHGPWIYIVE